MGRSRWRLPRFMCRKTCGRQWGRRPAVPEARALNRRERKLGRPYSGKIGGTGKFSFFGCNSGRKKKALRQASGGPDSDSQLVRNSVRRFSRLRQDGRSGCWRFRFRFTAIQPAHDIGTDGPRCNLRGLRLLAFAVGLLVGRADERAFNEHVSALLDGRGHTLCQEWPEYDDSVPLCFRAPFVSCVLPRALCSNREHGELRTVTFRLTLLGVRTNEPDESYRVEVRHS